MSFANPIILANQGDNNYKFVSRDWLTTPVKAEFIRLFLADESMLQQTLEIRTISSTGKLDKRQIALSTYPKATDKTSLILLIPLTPPLLLDGNTFFRLNVPAQSTVRMMFYYERRDLKGLLR